MDPYSGRTFELGADLTGNAIPGDFIPPPMLAQRLVAAAAVREITDDEILATQARALVAVSPEVAHQARLGRREMERRRARRKAAKHARKGNR